MKVLIAALLFISFSLCCFGNDSLIVALRSMPNDTNKVWAYRTLAFDLMDADTDTAQFFATKGIELSRKLDFYPGIIKSLLVSGYVFETDNNFNAALKQHFQALEISNQIGDEAMTCSIYNIIGFAYYYQGDLANALTYFDKAEILCAEIGDQAAYGQALNNIGVIFKADGKYAEAAETYRKSIRVKELQQDSSGLANSWFNLAISESYLGNEAESISAFEIARNIYLQKGDSANVISVLVGYGQTFCHFDRYPEAIEVLSEALTYEKHISKPTLYLIVSYYAQALRFTGEYEEALRQLNRIYPDVKDSDRYVLLRMVELELASCYVNLKRFEEAIPHYDRMLAFTDTINNAEKRDVLQELQTQYQTKEKEATIALQQKDIEFQKRQKLFLSIAVILAAALLVFALFFALNKIKTNRVLDAQKKVIEGALQDKELLLREIHHRVKNNLQVVSSLLSLHSRNIEDAEAQDAMLESRNRVQAMALIHESLYSHDDLRNIQASTYIERLCSNIFNSYKIDPEKIALSTKIDQLKLDIDETVPLGLIINELITNAVKYAFKEDGGTIHIALNADNNVVTLSVADNGVGYAEGAKPGFGTRLINSFAKKLRAEWSVLNDAGTTVTIMFPSKEKSAHPQV
ncbi:MAG: tetratricopeptide repeat protein [Flavobacteriales bacterium]|nr:tetratricopeptide repeat protein [Flavobacteriales bacterium]